MKFHKKQINFPFFPNKLSQLRSLLVCILTCRELSSIDIREAKERAGFTNIETGRIRATIIDGMQQRVELLSVFLSRNRCGSVCTSASGSRNEQENARGKRESRSHKRGKESARARSHDCGRARKIHVLMSRKNYMHMLWNCLSVNKWRLK